MIHESPAPPPTLRVMPYVSPVYSSTHARTRTYMGDRSTRARPQSPGTVLFFLTRDGWVAGMLARTDGAALRVAIMPLPTGTSNNYARDLGACLAPAALEYGTFLAVRTADPSWAMAVAKSGN